VSPVKYELGFYIPEDDILHSHSRENFKSYILVDISSKQHLSDIQCVCHESLSKQKRHSHESQPVLSLMITGSKWHTRAMTLLKF
jgi:hypothetical protein